MIIPSKDDLEIKGHPYFAEKNIYPNDNVLALLYDFFKKENESDEKALFMIFFGYSSINEQVEYNDKFGNPIIFCNLFANGDNILNRLYELGEVSSSVSPEVSNEENIRLSLKIPFFKRKILSEFEKNQVNCLEDLLNKIDMSKDIFFIIMNGEYKNFEEKLFEILKITNISTLLNENIDLARMIKYTLNINPEEIFDYIDEIFKKENYGVVIGNE